VGIDLLKAWRYGRGKGVVVAVVDTGIVPQPEFRGRILPGYDFVSNVLVANDGDGRDADPRDPGDWVTKSEAEGGEIADECEADESSWHGTHVAGIALAAANNERGIAGIAPRALLLPVRALGKCGGTDRDLVDALRWAGGLRVSGVPENRNPASVINVSLGGSGQCSNALQSAIDELSELEVIVVAAVGNDAIPAADYTPANCAGTLTVAATDSSGQRAQYSNYGAYVDLSAPGGTNNEGVLSTVDRGRQRPQGAVLGRAAGTSMAAPHVTGALAIARGLDPSISRVELLTLLLDHLVPFAINSAEYGCDIQDLCGAGFLDAGAFITALQSRPDAVVEVSAPDELRIEDTAEYSVTVDGEVVTPELLTEEVCFVDGTMVTGLTRGTCELRVEVLSTAQRKGSLQRFSFSVIGLDPVLNILAPEGMLVGERLSLEVTHEGDGLVSYRTRTPSVCRITPTGRIRALKSGTCRVRVSLGQTERYEAARKRIEVAVTP
jgi:serine protease